MAPVVRPRVLVGRDVRSLRDEPDGIEIEGPVRLRPGREVDILVAAPAGGWAVRSAVVWSWTLVRVARTGPIFRGLCYWT